MKWPWVGRLAYEAVLSERDRLRAQNDSLIQSFVALQRKQHGMKEMPPTRQRDPEWMTENIPRDVMDMVQGWDSQEIRNSLVLDIRNARREGTPWSEIRRLLEMQDDDPAEQQ